MSALLIPCMAILLGASPQDAPDAGLVRIAREADRYLVAVFPRSRLDGVGGSEDEMSLREKMLRRLGRESTPMVDRLLGTGIILGKEGEIITSAEVIPPGAGEVGVRFSDGRTEVAQVVAPYGRGAMVLLRVDAGGLTPAPLGVSRKVRIGDVVFTAGNVLGSIDIDGAVAISRGVVSGIGRARPQQYEYRGPVLETDAAVNAGLFGGALLDSEGQVIGIIHPGYSGGRWLGQAIPVDVLREALVHLREGVEPRPTLGMKTEGSIVKEVLPDGPADRAGLEVGDRILEVDGQEISGRQRPVDRIWDLPGACRVPVRVRRGAEEMTLWVRIGCEGG